MTGSRQWGAERLHRRIASTARQETSVGDIPVVFDLGAAWSRLPSTPDQLQLTDGNLVIIAKAVGSSEPPDRMVRLLTSSPAPTDLHAGERDGDHWPVQMEVDGQPVTAGFRSATALRDIERCS